MASSAAAGLFGAYQILTADDPPRWCIALAGIFAALGGVAAATVVIGLIALVIEDVRPTFMARKPRVDLSLAHREASLIGRSRYRLHPIRFWAGLTLNTRFGLVLMVFDKPEYIDFKDERDAA